jgi:hypothetical protein
MRFFDLVFWRWFRTMVLIIDSGGIDVIFDASSSSPRSNGFLADYLLCFRQILQNDREEGCIFPFKRYVNEGNQEVSILISIRSHHSWDMQKKHKMNDDENVELGIFDIPKWDWSMYTDDLTDILKKSWKATYPKRGALDDYNGEEKKKRSAVYWGYNKLPYHLKQNLKALKYCGVCG